MPRESRNMTLIQIKRRGGAACDSEGSAGRGSPSRRRARLHGDERVGRGFLSGHIRRLEDLPEGDYRRSSPRFQGENSGKDLQLVDRVRVIAAEKGVTASQPEAVEVPARNPGPGRGGRARARSRLVTGARRRQKLNWSMFSLVKTSGRP